LRRNPQTQKYTYANWGSRKWEYYYVGKLLEEIGIAHKNVVDIGIGLPSDSNFYEYYVESDCNLIGLDPDTRLDDITQLSETCCIYRKSAEKMSSIEDGSTDVVVALSSLEHFPFEAFNKTIQEVHRSLKDDGHFIVTLDLTYDKRSSAPWAILEKTMNGLPVEENDERLEDRYQQLTLEHFIKLISPYFYSKDESIANRSSPVRELVYSKKWNSHIAYMHLYKVK